MYVIKDGKKYKLSPADLGKEAFYSELIRDPIGCLSAILTDDLRKSFLGPGFTQDTSAEFDSAYKLAQAEYANVINKGATR